MYDHKLGPVCACPDLKCDWLKNNFDNHRSIIQDGLNTKSNIFNITKSNYVLQIHKFTLENENIRGGKLRCCLYSFVPHSKPLLPEKTLEEIIAGLVEKTKTNENRPDNDECSDYMLEWENNLNSQLVGEIGSGQLEHKFRDTLTTIIGYAELLVEGYQGELNDEQKESATYILKYSKELLNLRDICID
jgi:hypothetical protein